MSFHVSQEITRSKAADHLFLGSDILHFMSKKKKYVVRPMLHFGCGGLIGLGEGVSGRDSLHLGGYVVELALKNMEYRAMDRQYHKERLVLSTLDEAVANSKANNCSGPLHQFVVNRFLAISSWKAHEAQTAFPILSNEAGCHDELPRIRAGNR